MKWPTSQDYNEAVQDPAGSFSDPGLKGGSVVTNALGLPVPRSGNFADVYQFTDAAGRTWALKCFTRRVPGLRERYAKIDQHLARAKLPFTVGFKFLQEGVKVGGEWYPLLKMEWVEGFTVNDFVAENAGKPQYLHALMQMWAKLAGRLRDADMAHADLQHGNVLLVPGATPQKLGLKLIDYDGMWVPALAEHHSGEVGHPNYQHPLRLKEKLYNGDVDRFPHLVIGAALRATLIGGKPLWDKFDNGDNLLFKEADFKDPGKAPVFKALWELNDPVLRTLVGQIALATRQPLRKTPWLDDVLFEDGGPHLSPEQERQVRDLLGVSAAAPVGTKAAPPAAVQQEFNVFEFLDDDEPAAPTGERSGPGGKPVSSYRRKPPPKKSKAPLLIGAGVAAAVLLAGGIVVAMTLGGKKPATQEIAQRKDKEKDDTPGHVDPNRSGPPKIDLVGDKEPPPAVPIADAGVANREALRQSLAGTKWNWGDAVMEFRPDGVLYHPVWDERFHINTRWEVLDRRTAVLVGVRGRPRDCYSVLEFAEDLGSFTAFDYGQIRRAGTKPRVGPLAKPFAGPKTEDSAGDLRQRLTGSEWEWEAGTLRLKDDGTAELPRAPGRPRLTAQWEAIDRRTALVLITAGKTRDRMAILQFSEDVRELTGYDFEGAARLPARKRLDAGTAPAPSPKGGPVIAVAAAPTGRDYLFVRRGDPDLYVTQDGTAQKARPLGKANSPIQCLAVSPDGSRAVTGGEDGTVGIWDLKADGAATAGAGAMKTLIGNFNKIDTFKGRWSVDAYQEGIVVHDHERNLDATIPIGEPGHPVKEGFANNLKNNEKLPERLGEALTDEVKLYGGDLTVQVFEGGVQLYSRTVNKSWFAWHAKRKLADTVKTEPGGPPAARPPKSLKGHTGPVLAAAVSPSGKRAVTLGKDARVCVWDLSGNKLVDKFEVPGATCVAYTGDENRVIIGTETQSAEVWDLIDQKSVNKLPGHMVPVRAACVSPTGDRAWTGGEDGQVRTWKLPAYEYAGSVFPDRQGVAALAAAPDGRAVAVAGPAGTIRLINPRTGAADDVLAGKTPVAGLTWTNDGNDLIAAATGPRPVVIHINWPAKPAPEPKKSPSPVETTDKGGFLKESAPLPDTIYGCVISSDGKKVFAATHRGAIHVLNATTAAESGKYEASKAPLYQLVLVPKSTAGSGVERLYALDDGRHLHVLDAEKGTRVKDVDLGKNGLPTVSPNTRLVVTPSEAYVMVFDTDTGKAYGWNQPRWGTAAIPPILRRAPFEQSTRMVGFSSDGTLGGALALGKLLVWKEKVGTAVRTLDYGVNANWIGLSPDAGAVTAIDGGKVKAWKFESGLAALTERDPHGILAKVYASATPAGLVTVGSDRWLRVWDLRAGKEEAAWQLEHMPRGVTTSADGKLAAVWFDDVNTVGLWALPDLKGKKQ